MATNRLLSDKDRDAYKSLIDDMFRVCPDVMGRKIPRANVQQAFVLSTVVNSGTGLPDKSIISVGCYDDTAYEFLNRMKFNIIGIDPAYNYDLHSFRQNINAGFDIAFATSVLEHVKDDEEFIKDMCDILLPGGIGILTCDFNNSYRVGDRLPQTDLRFYTEYDLNVRLNGVLKNNGCALVDLPDWNGEPEFAHDGCNYSFATFVFRKNVNVQ